MPKLDGLDIYTFPLKLYSPQLNSRAPPSLCRRLRPPTKNPPYSLALSTDGPKIKDS